MKAYTSRVSKRTRAKKTASSARAPGVDRRARSTTTSFLGKNRLTERWRWRARSPSRPRTTPRSAKLAASANSRRSSCCCADSRRSRSTPPRWPPRRSPARASRRRRRRSRFRRREGPRRRDPPPPTRRRFFAWRSCPASSAGRAALSLNEIRDVASVANGQTPPLLDSLRVVAEASRARDAARGVSASGMGEKGARRRKTNHGGDALQDALQDARDALDPLDTSLPKRQRNVDETKKTASRGVGDVRVRFGDPRFATSAEAFGDEPAAHANVADAADALARVSRVRRRARPDPTVRARGVTRASRSAHPGGSKRKRSRISERSRESRMRERSFRGSSLRTRRRARRAARRDVADFASRIRFRGPDFRFD